MGWMQDGAWHVGWYQPDKDGAFQRPPAKFRGRISADGEFRAEAGRYHLYVSYACPWAQRTLITRALRGLSDAISVTAVDPKMGDDGWVFAPDEPDPLLGAPRLQDVYRRARADYTGRVTVPVLWDKRTNTLVNNESREIMRMLDTELNAFARSPRSLAPPHLRAKIDETLDAIYQPINNGVYRAGFAGKQEAYERACRELFAALDRWEQVLGKQRYMCGAALTEADVAMFTTLLRFDLVYYGHFKCNLRRLQDYPNLWGFVRDVYQTDGVADTCRFDHIKTHYYWSQTTVNPHRIVPLGPAIDFGAPHDRQRF
ncbi:MAG: glutathione S-transferase family protein [Deltaproteobacteria bacterium]|nr:glutathione S-transferase family protein [Deltaproteobacteria bacterium]